MTKCNPFECKKFVKKMMEGYQIKRTDDNIKRLKEKCPLLLDNKYCMGENPF